MYTHAFKHMGELYKAIAIGLFVTHTIANAEAPIINPGAPGQPKRLLSAEKAIQLANTGYSRDDVRLLAEFTHSLANSDRSAQHQPLTLLLDQLATRLR